MAAIKRGDIYYVDFSPVEGHEQSGVRPAVVMSANHINVEDLGLAFVIPGTTAAQVDPGTNEVLADVVRVEPSRENGLKQVTYFLCSQLRAVSLKRLTTPRTRVGILTDNNLYNLEEIVIALLDLGPKDE